MMPTRFFNSISAAVLCLTALAACQFKEPTGRTSDGKILIVATIFPLADWAGQIGGDLVHVETLLPAGSSPHTFDPSPKEMRNIANARMFLKVGLKMDDWGSKLAKASKSKNLGIISLGDYLAESGKLPEVDSASSQSETLGADEAQDFHIGHDHDHDHAHGHDHGDVNPHFWLDPEMAIACVEKIRDALIEADPANKQAYTENTSAYLNSLRQLNEELANSLSALPNRGFVSFHNAYPYLANRYRLTVAAVIEEYAGKTPSQQYIKKVADRLRELKITTVFSEPQLNPRVAQIIAAEINGRVDVMDPYGSEGAEGRSSYIELMRFNGEKLAKALGTP